MGLYSHVQDRWGILYAQPLILNDQRQAGAAIDGVIRHEELDITRLAVDTHAHTDFAMALAKLLGFDLCLRLTALKEQHLFLPRGTQIPASIEQIVHLVASVHSGRTSAVHVTARFGSASRSDSLYEAVNALKRSIYTGRIASHQANQRRSAMIRLLEND